MISFTTSVRIDRPVEEVYAFVAEPVNLPRWNSAVLSVRRTSGFGSGGGSYVMERELPLGRATNRLDVVAKRAPDEFTIRATGGPTPFVYRYRFAPENGQTLLTLEAEVDLPGVRTFVPRLARRAIENGVEHNFAALKRILEREFPAAGGAP